jgi:hypothetical protein
MGYIYICTKQSPDGSFDQVGSTNRTVVSGYKSWQSALRYGIRPWAGKDKCVRVETYYNTVHGNPIDVFHTVV